ncbi:hypothetical protein Pla22_30560 [Rubripirellula amarantea]|uniref:Uncharacterized protein n=1 Tax=Rubripirellula amarantea TaxID=2527999 RepID=A0A5C5WHN0_9BACT|nr:hypothetical protein [Rubripirellula amarantea]TWT50314.1 hypothetical protein Pla22_30560 [Rubripirellula amarantea]
MQVVTQVVTQDAWGNRRESFSYAGQCWAMLGNADGYAIVNCVADLKGKTRGAKLSLALAAAISYSKMSHSESDPGWR